jgi:hypothetical protein
MGVARTAAGRARLAACKAKRHGDRYAGFKAIVELAAKLLRLVGGVWRSGQPYDPARADGSPAETRRAAIAIPSGTPAARLAARGGVEE